MRPDHETEAAPAHHAAMTRTWSSLAWLPVLALAMAMAGCDSEEAAPRCEGPATRPCQTPCGSEGSEQRDPDTCEWAACEPPAELCNGSDDDCNGVADDGLGCVQGAEEPCRTTCGSEGSRTCGSSCEWTDCEPGPELCGNGVDDDCDGVTDPEPTITTVHHWERGGPSMLAALDDGSLILAQPQSNRERPLELQLARFGDGGELEVPPGPERPTPWADFEVAAAGSKAAAIRFDARRLMASVFPGDGVEVELASDVEMSLGQSLVRFGGVWVAAYSANSSVVGDTAWRSVFVRAFGDDGEPRGPAVRVSDGGDPMQSPSIAAGDGVALVVWHDGRPKRVRYASIGTDLAIARSQETLELPEGTTDARGPVAAWNGEGFVVAYQASFDNEPAHLYAIAVAGEGAAEAPHRVSTGSAHATAPRILWTGSKHLVAWMSAPQHRSTHRVRLAHLDRSGRRQGPIVAVGRGAMAQPRLSMALVGPRLLFQWREADGGAHLSALSCD